MKICLVGHGHLGRWHAEEIQKLYGKDFMGIVEADIQKHSEIAIKYPNVKITSKLDEIIDSVDAVVIATPTTFHFELIKKTLSRSKHCFVEKPMTADLTESTKVSEMLAGKNVIFQVGHSERFHPFWSTLQENENFESVSIARLDRVAPYKGRGDDVDIIYDLMIHDYDLLTMLGFGEPKEIQAWGRSCHTSMIDYCLSKLVYENRIVFVSASRSNIQERRSAEFIFPDGLLEVDLLNSEIRRSKKGAVDTSVSYDKRDHLLEEHKLFKSCIESGVSSEINYEVGHQAMKLLDMTKKSIKECRSISWRQ